MSVSVDLTVHVVDEVLAIHYTYPITCLDKQFENRNAYDNQYFTSKLCALDTCGCDVVSVWIIGRRHQGRTDGRGFGATFSLANNLHVLWTRKNFCFGKLFGYKLVLLHFFAIRKHRTPNCTTEAILASLSKTKG